MQHDMLLIQALDIGASVKHAHAGLTDGRPAWYVQADIEKSDGVIIGSVSTGGKYYATPWEALQAYRIALQEIPEGTHLVTRRHGVRTEWYWNGAAWSLAVPFEELAS
jgi:hypothetical protein